MYLTADKAKLIATDHVARALHRVSQIIDKAVCPEDGSTPAMFIEVSINQLHLPVGTWTAFKTELTRLGYNVTHLKDSPDESLFSLRIDWIKPIIFNSKMEV